MPTASKPARSTIFADSTSCAPITQIGRSAAEQRLEVGDLHRPRLSVQFDTRTFWPVRLDSYTASITASSAPAVRVQGLALGPGPDASDEAVELAAEHERLIRRRRARPARAPPRLRQLDLVPASVRFAAALERPDHQAAVLGGIPGQEVEGELAARPIEGAEFRRLPEARSLVQNRREAAADGARLEHPHRAVAESHEHRPEVFPETNLGLRQVVPSHVQDLSTDGLYLGPSPPSPQVDVVRQVVLEDAAADGRYASNAECSSRDSPRGSGVGVSSTEAPQWTSR